MDFLFHCLLLTLFTETYSSQLIYELIKALEVRTSIVFNLSVLNMLILLFVHSWLIFLIPAMIAQIFIPTAELVIPTGTQTNKPNAEI